MRDFIGDSTVITERRQFLAALPQVITSTLLAARRAAASENELHVLKGDNLERLRLDFNASRSKVRMLYVLSPT